MSEHRVIKNQTVTSKTMKGNGDRKNRT